MHSSLQTHPLILTRVRLDGDAGRPLVVDELAVVVPKHVLGRLQTLSSINFQGLSLINKLIKPTFSMMQTREMALPA